MADSIPVAVPIYASEPVTGKDTVLTGALAIRNKRSIVLVVSFGNA